MTLLKVKREFEFWAVGSNDWYMEHQLRNQEFRRSYHNMLVLTKKAMMLLIL